MIFHGLRKVRTLLSILLVFISLAGLLSLASPVQAVSGNLVGLNPGFEEGNFSGWSNTSGWVNQSTTTHHGTHAAYCNYTGSGSCSTSINTGSYYAPQGRSIQISIWGRISNSSSTITLQPIWTLSSGAVFADPEVSMNITNTWQKLTLNQIAPKNATGVKVKATISAVNGAYYLDDAVIYDYYPDHQAWEYIDLNDNPDTQVTTEGVDTTAQYLNSSWLESVSSKKSKAYTFVFLDSNEDGIYQPTEMGVPGITINQDKCWRTGGWTDICSGGDFNSGSSSHKTGITDALKGAMTVRWLLPSQGKYLREKTNEQDDFYCSLGDCTQWNFVKNTSIRWNHGLLPALTGVLKVQTSTECTNNSLPSECYKLFFDGGYRWITRDTTLGQGEMTSREGKRVRISGPFYNYTSFPWPGSPRKAKSIATVDYLVHYGLGGGDVTDLVNSTTIQNDLGKPSTHPSVVWSQIEPNAPSGGDHNYIPISETVSRDLYKGMKYCKDNSLTSCGVTLTWDANDSEAPGNGLPLWVESGTQQVCGDGVAAEHVGDLAALAAFVANSTIDGVKIKDIADSFALYNEPDLNESGNNCTVENYAWQYETVATMMKQASVSARMSTAGFGLEDSQKAGSLKWVDDFFARVNPDLIDRVNIHWYENFKGSANPQWSNYDTYTGKGGVRAKLIWLNQTMQRYGIIGKTVTLGEIGDAEQNPGYYYGTGSADTGQGDALQKDNLFKEFAQVYSANVPISSVLWFKLKGSGDPDGDLNEATDNEHVNSSFRKNALIFGTTNRPSYVAYKTIAAELNGSRFWRYDETSGIEGYIFLDSSNSAKEVIWSRSSSPVNVQFWGNSVRKVDTAGNVSTVYGSGGFTTVSITQSPVIIDY